MTAQWRPTTAQDHRLWEAKTHGDADAYLRHLLRADLFHPTLREDAGPAVEGGHVRAPTWHLDGRTCTLVYSRGTVPDPDPLCVYHTPSLRWILDSSADHDRWLVVNAGSPLEMRFPLAHVQRWVRENPDAVRENSDPVSALVTMWNGPLHGPLAHAFACGGHLAVQNGTPWNLLGETDGDYFSSMRMLREQWGLHSPAEWGRVMSDLLGDESSDPGASLVLGIRRHTTASTDPVTWRDTLDRWCRHHELPRDTCKALSALVGRILRYEGRMRADGLLAPDGVVHDVVAYDFGRAVNMARWGLQGQFTDHATARQALLRAGAQARRHYTSWADFSAGYVLGRLLRFDGEEFGEWYRSMLLPHRILMQDKESPWRNIPF